MTELADYEIEIRKSRIEILSPRPVGGVGEGGKVDTLTPADVWAIFTAYAGRSLCRL
jgi:hypothetical protein